jgi:DNA repair exonuclease SbcCD ATPase subunit
LILDEPTNDLDLDTIRLIEDFLREWPGTLIVVSHDRSFLSQTTDRLLEVHRDATVTDVPGGIDAWIARSLGVSLEQPVPPTAPSPTTPVPATASKSKRLRELEKDMARLERQMAKMAERILATEDYVAAGALTKDLTALRDELHANEEEWLQLSDDSSE